MYKLITSLLLMASIAGAAWADQTSGVPGVLNPINAFSSTGSNSTSTGSSSSSTNNQAPAGATPGNSQQGSQPILSSQPATQGTPGLPTAVITPASPQFFDYTTNLNTDVFGAQLFTGAFARQGSTQFNPDYTIANGDSIQLKLWGGFEYEGVLIVDPQGNIFLPHMGPLKLQGVRNQDLQRVVESAVNKVYRANVYSYASLAAAQPVRIYVGGFVNRPGLYNGTSMDSLLHYLDQAGGIDADRGSFIDVQVKRAGKIRTHINLYDFLLDGRMPLVQFGDGDVIFVPPRQNTVKINGLVGNAKRFEFDATTFSVTDLIRIAKPTADATHIRVTRNTGIVKNIEYFPLDSISQITINNGDEVEFTADKRPGTITVRVQGEHLSPQEYVLPYGARLGALMANINASPNADIASLQLFRQSVRDRQKAILATSLKSLEASLLTARSGTNEEAELRKQEADLVMQWVERAKTIEPTGQVLIAQSVDKDQLLLENGDIINIPTKDGLVFIGGEVLFPNTVAYDGSLNVNDYIKRAGGYTQNADNSRIVIAHRDGSFDDGTKVKTVKSGDEVLILPKIDVKSRQIFKDLTQMVFQIALAAKVVIGF